MTKFEQHISEIWCNGRKLKYNLLKRITNDDKIQFVNLDSRLEITYICNIICISGNELHFYSELVLEILDALFLQFCARSFSIEYSQDSTDTDCILKYLAHRGFKEHLGSLQYWYHSRFDDERGRYLSKVQELQDPSTKHFCEECVFSDLCTHECCFKLLKSSLGQKILFRENGDCRLVESSLGKRQRNKSAALKVINVTVSCQIFVSTKNNLANP